MALFKIHKGSANNLGKTGNITQYTQEGYAYFTTEDGKFYIDIAGDGTTPVQLGVNRLPLNAYKADRDEDGNRIATNYVKRTKETKQTISVTGGGTALRLNSFNKHGSLIEFSNTQSSTNESGETVETQVSLGYLGVWEGSPCYYYNDNPYNILHAGNYSNYALPLSGGTMTGSLSVNGGVQAGSVWSRQTSAEASVGVQNGALNSQLYLYANSSACGLYFSNSGNGANGNVIKVTADGTKTFYGNVTGTATKLATARTISLTGSVTGSGSFDGSGNLSIATTTNHTHTSLPDGTSVSGHLRIGNNVNGDTNYIAFYGTQGDQPGSYNHTFIGENLYGTSETSELIIFKGNDIGNGPTVPSEPGPERIRHIAATHLFQSYTTPLLGSFVEICDSTAPINIMGIDSAGVYVYKNLTVNGTLNGNASSASKLATARTISLTGSVTGSGSFDGSGNLSIATTTNHSHSYLPLSGGTLSGPVYTTSAFTTSAGTVSQFASAPLGGLFSNGVAFTNPTTRNDVGWIRILGTGESDTVLEIAVGDDGGGSTAENIAVRQYNTSNAIAREAYLLNAAGNTTFPGSVTAASVYGAVWNDYAEYRSQNETIEPGYITYCDDDGKLKKTTERLQKYEGIVSDTFGFAIGETDDCKTPLAVSGRALVYCDPEEEHFHSGDCVCAGPDGLAYRMTREEIIEFPDRIVGVVSEIPTYETWGTGNVKVNGRIWVKVK